MFTYMLTVAGKAQEDKRKKDDGFIELLCVHKGR